MAQNRIGRDHFRMIPHPVKLAAAVLALGSACAGGDERDSADLPQISPARLEEHIRYLASDRLQGRGTGTPGYDSAAR
jgi:hypothetical protein